MCSFLHLSVLLNAYYFHTSPASELADSSSPSLTLSTIPAVSAKIVKDPLPPWSYSLLPSPIETEHPSRLTDSFFFTLLLSDSWMILSQTEMNSWSSSLSRCSPCTFHLHFPCSWNTTYYSFFHFCATLMYVLMVQSACMDCKTQFFTLAWK